MPHRHSPLFAPLGYWRIRHPAKRRWDFALPLCGACALTAGLLFWPSVPTAYGPGGFLPSLQTLFAIMGGFFVSALTLISTSSAPGLLQPLIGNPPIRMGKSLAPITRQRFLALLFGYLAFSAFALYAIGFLAMLIAPGMRSLVPADLHRVASAVFLLPYNFWLCHVLVSTLVGLYYFTDRLQRPDPEIKRAERHTAPAE